MTRKRGFRGGRESSPNFKQMNQLKKDLKAFLESKITPEEAWWKLREWLES